MWTLTRGGREHRVVAGGSGAHRVRWYVDGELRAEKKAWEEKLRLEDGDTALQVRFATLGAPRRATLVDPEDGEVDLVPEPGSRAAAYEDKVREHPTRYALVATAGGVAKVVLPILLGLVAVRFAVNLPWPSVPLPDLPDLPSIPWPDLPDWELPHWVRWTLDKAKYVWPVVLAFVLARAEIRRRRQQDEKRADQSGARGRLD